MEAFYTFHVARPLVTILSENFLMSCLAFLEEGVDMIGPGQVLNLSSGIVDVGQRQMPSLD